MRHLLKLSSLLLVLLVAQQGAVDHEIGHLARAATHNLNAAVLDPSCAQCPAFAQVVTPAFSYSLHIPPLILAAADRMSALPSALINAAALEPRSRGPPAKT
jgi:5,10-methenyltetrahydromethanopterin hydrogenase